MTKVAVTEQYLTDIANAIRAKSGTSGGMTPADMASAISDIPSGGASNFVHGTFTTGSTTGATSFEIPYTGNGYPVMAVVVIAGGAYNSAYSHWHDKVQRYAVGQWTMTKSVMSSTPTYTTSGNENWGVTTAIFKSSTSSSHTYSRTSGMNTNVFSSSDATASVLTCVRFKSNTTLSHHADTSSYGLLPETDYEYFIVYSS